MCFWVKELFNRSNVSLDYSSGQNNKADIYFFIFNFKNQVYLGCTKKIYIIYLLKKYWLEFNSISCFHGAWAGKMGKKCDLTSFVKGQIYALNSLGYSQSKIANKLKISRCAVQNALRRRNSSKRKNCGWKRVSSAREDRFMKKIVAESPHTSSARIAHLLSEQGKKLRARTVRRRLSEEFNLVARRPAKKPLLTQK